MQLSIGDRVKVVLTNGGETIEGLVSQFDGTGDRPYQVRTSVNDFWAEPDGRITAFGELVAICEILGEDDE